MSTFKNKHVLITGGAGGIGFLMGEYNLRYPPYDGKFKWLKKLSKFL